MSKFLLALGMCLAATICVAQTTLTGTVTDGNEPLVGATVLVPNTVIGTVTDLDGKYQIEIPAGTSELCVSYAGGKANCQAIGANTTLDFVLSTQILDEVVITALGLERDNAKLGYAIESLDASEISDVPATNFLDNLSGQIAGVNVATGPTGVGSTSLVSIRGDASFGSNTPLYIVDGIPIDNRSVLNVTNEGSQGFQEVDFGGGSPEVSPFDVQSVSVLKGPAAAALYGTRAANGVIIINTKPGNANNGLGIEVNSQTMFERPFRLPSFQNEYGQGRNGEFSYLDGVGGGINDNITFSYGPKLHQGTLLPQFDSPVQLANGQVVRGADHTLYQGEAITPTPFNSNPNNVADLYETGVTTQNNIALSQGFSGGNYRISFTDMRSDSYIPGVNLERNNVAARLNFTPTKKLTVSTGLTYVNTRSDNRPASGYGSENLNYSLVAWLGRSTNLESLRNYWQPGQEGIQQFTYNTNFFDNPFFILHENRNSFTRDRLFGYVAATYDLTDKLAFRLRTGIDNSDEDRQFRRAFSSNRWRNGAYAENAVNFTEQNTDALLTYTDQFKGVSFSASIGGNRLDQRADFQQVQAEALSAPGIYRLSSTAVPLVAFGQLTERRINSVYGLASIGWRDQIFVDVSGRNDWSSSLATPTSADNTSFFYPSVSASWVASKTFDLTGGPISFLQVRGSAAQVGSDTDPYRTAGSFVASTPVGGNPTYTDQLQLPANGLRPERSTAFEGGVDVRFLDDKFGLDLTLYTQLNEDQILNLPTPISSGYESRVVNGGAVRATGIEAVVTMRGINLGPLRYDGRINFTKAQATVESLPEGVDRTTIAYARVYSSPGQTVFYIAEEGSRIGDMYGTGYLRNDEGQYIVNSDGEFIADNTLRKLGNYTPDFQVGLSNTLRYNQLSLSFLVDWRQGGELVSRTQALGAYSGQLDESSFRPAEGILIPGVVNTGTAEAPVYEPNTTRISAEDYYITYYNREHEEHNTLDATFVKLRELRLGYSLDAININWLNNFEFALIGRNLAAWSPGIRHFDPEQFAVQGNRFVRGVEDMSYPTPRSIGFSINAKF